MTYNQVQWFQINDYANHYVDIEITGYRALYSKSIAGRGIARQQGQLTTLIEYLTIILEYIDLFQFFWQGTAKFWLGPPLATSLKQGTQLIFKILEVYLCDHYIFITI